MDPATIIVASTNPSDGLNPEDACSLIVRCLALKLGKKPLKAPSHRFHGSVPAGKHDPRKNAR